MATLEELMAEINTHTTALNQLLAKAKLPAPSFAPDAPPSLSHGKEFEDIQVARMSLIEVAQAIRDLALGPVDSIRAFSDGVVTEFQIPQLVPLYGDVSFCDIAAKLGLPEYRIHRILRHAMTFRVFCESRPGFVAHTGASAAFIQHPLLNDWVSFNLDEVWPADTKLAAALRRFGESEKPGDSAIGLAYGFSKDKTYWDFVASDGEEENKGWRQKRFAQGMKFTAVGSAHAHHHLHAAFDWAGLGKGTVVDVGGSTGHVSIEVAKAFPQLHFVVQDFASLESFHESVPDELQSRIRFQAQDILRPNALRDADVCLLRSILHDWSDKYAVLILQNLVPALKDGARVLITDFIIPETGTRPMWIEPLSTIKSMQMTTVVNAKERTEADWAEVVQHADFRYSIVAAVTPPGAPMAVIEIVFRASR